MMKTHKQQVKELEDMIAIVEEEEKKKQDEAQNENQSFKEEVKNKDLEDLNTMKLLLDARQNKYYNDLEQMHQKYVSDTAKKTEEHTSLFKDNKERSEQIDLYVR